MESMSELPDIILLAGMLYLYCLSRMKRKFNCFKSFHQMLSRENPVGKALLIFESTERGGWTLTVWRRNQQQVMLWWDARFKYFARLRYSRDSKRNTTGN